MSAISDLMLKCTKSGICNFREFPDATSGKMPATFSKKYLQKTCISIDGTYYDAPQQFISMKVEIRFLPDSMENAYILYDGVHYPIQATNKVANGKAKRNNSFPSIDYSRKEVSSHV